MADFKYHLPENISKEGAEAVINMMYTFQDIMAGIEAIEDEAEADRVYQLYQVQYLFQIIFQSDFPSLKYVV